ncbi:MAG: hypothetical protein AAFX85_10155, partial [Pseudomonadota bacterium]
MPIAATLVILLLAFPQVAFFDAVALWGQVASSDAWSFEIVDAGDRGLVIEPTSTVVSFLGGSDGDALDGREWLASLSVNAVTLTVLGALLFGAYLYSSLWALLRWRPGLLVVGLALPHVILGTSALVVLQDFDITLPGEMVRRAAGLAMLYVAAPVTTAGRLQDALAVHPFILAVLPQLAFLLSFLWITLKLKFLSRAVVVFVLVLALLARSLHASDGDSPYWVWSLNLLAAVGLILALRLSWLIVSQNFPLFRRLGVFGTLASGLRSALLWTPMLVLLAPFVLINENVRQSVKADLATSIADSEQALGLGNSWADSVPSTIPSDTHKLIALHAFAQIREIQAQAQQVQRLLATDLGDDAEAIVRAAMQPRIDFADPNNSGFLWRLKDAAESLAQ